MAFEAHLIVTSLSEKEWQGCTNRFDYHLQRFRVCGRKIYSHMAILFRNLPADLVQQDLSDISRSLAGGATEVVFESLQAPRPDGFLGFSTLHDPDGWYAQWKLPEIYFYRIDPTKVNPRLLFENCIKLARTRFDYRWSWARQAAYCPCMPCAACQPCNCDPRGQTSLNCVGAVALVIAACFDARALTDRAVARKTLRLSRAFPSLYFPSEMLDVLQREGLVPETAWRKLVLHAHTPPVPPPLPLMSMVR